MRCVLPHFVDEMFSFLLSVDGILHNASQEEVYKKCTSNQVTLALNGYNSTIFSYGQTGAGKTFTMTGDSFLFQHSKFNTKQFYHV